MARFQLGKKKVGTFANQSGLPTEAVPAVYTSNFGISVVYQCEYSTALTVSSDAFDVQANE